MVFISKCSARLAPDGKRIAVSGGYYKDGAEYSELIEINVNDGTEKRIQTPDWDKIGSAVWKHDNSALYVIAREKPNQPTQIFYLPFDTNKVVQKLTNNLHNYNSLSLSADSQFLAEQSAGKSDIWLAEKENASQIKQITFDDEENTGVNGLTFTPDGKIIYTSPRSGNIDLWMMNADGSDQKQLTSNLGGWNIRPRSSADGRYIVFQSFFNNKNDIWRMDKDGKNLIKLTNSEGDCSTPDISPDGQRVYFTLTKGDKTSIWKISINGGDLIRVSKGENVIFPSISPDGKFIAVNYEWESSASVKAGIISVETGELTKQFEISAFRRILRWSPDSKSLIYIQKNTPNLWEQPINEKSPRQLTNFNFEQTWNFAFSSDNQKIAFARGSIKNESVLINLQ